MSEANGQDYSADELREVHLREVCSPSAATTAEGSTADHG